MPLLIKTLIGSCKEAPFKTKRSEIDIPFKTKNPENHTHTFKRMLYNSLTDLPYFHYGNIFWGIDFPTRLDKLFKLQKKVLRFITFLSYIEPSLPLFTQLNLLNVYQINDFLIAFSFSLSKKVLPFYFSDFCLENHAQVHEYNTRNSLSNYLKFIEEQFMENIGQETDWFF